MLIFGIDSMASKQLRRLSKLAAHCNTEAAREAILADIDTLRELALANKRTWLSNSGEPREREEPDYTAALRGTELAARVLGVLNDKAANENAKPGAALTDEEFEQELAKAGRIMIPVAEYQELKRKGAN